MQQIWDEAGRLFDQGRVTEANALLEAAGKDLQDFMAQNSIGDRTSLRLRQSSEMFLSSAFESDMNSKRKMMKEHQNRQMRDRKPRDQEGN